MNVSNCKVGNRVVCIDNRNVEENLTIGEILVVREIENYAYSDDDYVHHIDTYINGYFAWRFESIRNSRKSKLEKLGG